LNFDMICLFPSTERMSIFCQMEKGMMKHAQCRILKTYVKQSLVGFPEGIQQLPTFLTLIEEMFHHKDTSGEDIQSFVNDLENDTLLQYNSAVCNSVNQ